MMQRSGPNYLGQFLATVWSTNSRPILTAGGALLFAVLLCTAMTDPQSVGGCVFGLVFLGLMAFGVKWWVDEQKKQEAIRVHTAWVFEQERQRRLQEEQQRQTAIAEQKRWSQLAQVAYAAEHERQRQAKVAEQERQRRFMETKTIDELLRKTPKEFEEAIASLLPSLGYVRVHCTGKAGDLGADVHCYTGAGDLVIVQCKRYAPGTKVSSPEIQKFIGARAIHGAPTGLFVTTSEFTGAARKLALKHNIQPIDGVALVRYIGYAQQRQNHP